MTEIKNLTFSELHEKFEIGDRYKRPNDHLWMISYPKMITGLKGASALATDWILKKADKKPLSAYDVALACLNANGGDGDFEPSALQVSIATEMQENERLRYAELVETVEEFQHRVDIGEARSTYTYNKFQESLRKINQSLNGDK